MKWGNDQQFLKESHTLVRYCKVIDCNGFMYRPNQDEWRTKMGLCLIHRRQYYRYWYKTFFIPWFKKLPKEKQDKYKKMQLANWNRWVTKNIDRRRVISLTSYHKHKERINKKRRLMYKRNKTRA